MKYAICGNDLGERVLMPQSEARSVIRALENQPSTNAEVRAALFAMRSANAEMREAISVAQTTLAEELAALNQSFGNTKEHFDWAASDQLDGFVSDEIT